MFQLLTATIRKCIPSKSAIALFFFISIISGFLPTTYAQTLADMELGSRTFQLISDRRGIPGIKNHAVGSYGERIWDLEEFQGKIYIGLGDWNLQSGPQPIVSYKPSSNSFATERTVNSDAIENYKRSSNFLFAPHTDECGSGVGTIDYIQDGYSWTSASPHDGGMHCFDATLQGGRIFAATGSSVGAQIRSMAPGGSSWTMEYQTTDFQRFKYIGSDSTTVFVTSEGSYKSYAKKDGAWFEVTTSGTNPWPFTLNHTMRLLYGSLCMQLSGTKLVTLSTIPYVGYQQQLNVAQADSLLPYEVIYAISTNTDTTKEIYVSSDFVHWKPLLTIADQQSRGIVEEMKKAWCLAYFANTLYIGMTTGNLYKIGNVYGAVSGLTLSPASLILKLNEQSTLTATVLAADATNKTVAYSSSDNTIATVNTNGVVTGLKYGTAQIFASFTYTGKTFRDTTMVSVTKVCTLTTVATNGTIALNPSGGIYASGCTVTLTACGNKGYAFSNWSGDLTDSTNPATIIMNGNKSVTAAFTVQTQTVWQSHNTRMQSGSPQATITSDEGGVTANLEFYESTNDDGVIKGSLFSTFTTGIHPETFNNVKAYWTNGTAQYPYAGTSTIIRGSDAGEANTPSPAGVLDLQMHPPSNLHLTVGAFIVPAGGTFTASNLAVRRVSSSGASAILKLFNSSKELIATLTATNSRVWVTDDKIYDLGNLAAGDRIYFAIDNADNYNNDATELFFTVTQKTKLATQSHFSSKSDPIKNLGISTIVTNKGFYFTLPRAAEYSLSIFTLNGIKVAEIIKARGMYGQNVVPLRIPNGIYLARLSTGANTIDREIQVLK